jgi:hypothetical protein
MALRERDLSDWLAGASVRLLGSRESRLLKPHLQTKARHAVTSVDMAANGRLSVDRVEQTVGVCGQDPT